jgi:hypothetical protein
MLPLHWVAKGDTSIGPVIGVAIGDTTVPATGVAIEDTTAPVKRVITRYYRFSDRNGEMLPVTGFAIRDATWQ